MLTREEIIAVKRIRYFIRGVGRNKTRKVECKESIPTLEVNLAGKNISIGVRHSVDGVNSR